MPVLLFFGVQLVFHTNNESFIHSLTQAGNKTKCEISSRCYKHNSDKFSQFIVGLHNLVIRNFIEPACITTLPPANSASFCLDCQEIILDVFFLSCLGLAFINWEYLFALLPPSSSSTFAQVRSLCYTSNDVLII